MKLYDQYYQRLYVNAAERQRFIRGAEQAAPKIRAFALTLVYTGCRLSEARLLDGRSLQREARVLSVRSMKKRGLRDTREVPIPAVLVRELTALNTPTEAFIWQRNGCPVPRIQAYRWIKALMRDAEITGAQACPKGLRHGYGVNATLSGVQLHMLKLWMGHASINTTAIYATVLGPDQLRLADRMWRE